MKELSFDIKNGIKTVGERHIAMKFPCTVSQSNNGEWSVRHDGTEIGPVEVSADSQEAALEKMRGELRYRLEICPCTGELYQDVQIEISL